MLFICIIYWLFEFYNCKSYIKENYFGEYVFYYMGISFLREFNYFRVFKKKICEKIF